MEPTEKKMNVQPVIMCGGAGTRLWPLSRAGFPKQFLALNGEETLFQQAAARLMGLGAAGHTLSAPLIVGNEEHRFLILEQLREARIDPDAILLEPVGRNTAPALTLAALAALEPHPSSLSTQSSALSPQHSVLSTQPSALSTQHSELSTQSSALNRQPCFRCLALPPGSG